MKLDEYRDKRNFGKTPEPESGESGDPERRIFVVQEHHARSLHFDFRLQVGDVLKSWAVPKGPSMNPGDKRLAVMVEDHPLGYARFEGEIPEGQYGAGTVEIWDSGTWEPDSGHRDVEAALADGVLDFFLHGRQLKGEFLLIRARYTDAPNGWILEKKKDAEAVDTPYDARQIPARS